MASLEQHEVDGGIRVVRVSGSLTQQSVGGIESALAAAIPDGARAVVDLAQVDLITTPGLALIVSTTQRLRNTSGRVVFAAPQGKVRDILRRCRLDEVLEMAGDVGEAAEKAKR